MILLIDNYDSFTYNLVDYFKQLNCEITVKKNDVEFSEIKSLKFDAILISPGPETPSKAGITNQVIEEYYKTIPILGICLGHQALGLFFGAMLTKAKQPRHGKVSEISTKSDVLYQNIKEKFNVTRYHSLVIKNLPNQLISTAISLDDNEIMSFKHKELPIWGIQFHPEAVLTENGINILNNWATFNNLIRL